MIEMNLADLERSGDEIEMIYREEDNEYKDIKI